MFLSGFLGGFFFGLDFILLLLFYTYTVVVFITFMNYTFFYNQTTLFITELLVIVDLAI